MKYIYIVFERHMKIYPLLRIRVPSSNLAPGTVRTPCLRSTSSKNDKYNFAKALNGCDHGSLFFVQIFSVCTKAVTLSGLRPAAYNMMYKYVFIRQKEV